MSAFVLDRNGRPLMPCSEKRARHLLARGRARVHRVMPFVIRLVDRMADSCALQPLRIKLDPGSKVTGVALVREADSGIAVINLFELIHRGRQISEALTARRGFRRRRRGANLRYRAPRFLNREKPEGWLPPSLQHRVDTTMAWVQRIRRWAPVTALSSELVRFDLQQLENPEISGLEYQQGTLAGYEVREYLLEKWKRTCIYCDAKDRPLQIEHLTARARQGSNRVGNLGLACGDCNQDKGALDVRAYVKDSKRLARILATRIASAARRGSCQYHPLGAHRHASGNRAAARTCIGRAHKVQPRHARPAEDTCPGRGVRGTGRRDQRLETPISVDQGYRARQLPAHAPDPSWFPAWLPHAPEAGSGVPDGRPRACGCAHRQEGRHSRRTCRRSCHRLIQHPDGLDCRARHQPPPLQACPAWRWLRLFPSIH